MNAKTLLTKLVILVLLIFFISCTRHVTKFDPDKDVVIFPAPPDTARIQYLTSISNSQQITGKRSGFAKFILGDSPSREIVKPYGLAVHGNKVYVCDTGLGGIEIIDLKRNEFDYFIPKGKGQLILPLNCSLDEKGYLYVADGERKQIVVFDTLGNYVDAFGEAEDFKPTDVFVKNDTVWVANMKKNQVIAYGGDSYSKLFSFPDSHPGEDGYLYSPTNLYLTDGEVYVSDMGDSRIKKYSHDGKYTGAIGSFGKGLGQFVRVKGIALDHDENLYAVDASFENVQLFNQDGNMLMYFGGTYQGPGYMWLPAKVAIDYGNLDYFSKYTDPNYSLQYLVFVTNQYGPDKVSVYGFVEPKDRASR